MRGLGVLHVLAVLIAFASPAAASTAQPALHAVGFSTAVGHTGDGVAVGDSGLVLRTVDGGVTWMRRHPGVQDTLRSLWFADLNVGWSVGDAGTIVKTGDRGTAWTRQSSGTTATLNGVYCTCVNNCWAVGEDGVIRRTANGGATWYGQYSGVASTLNSVQIASYTATGWIAGDGGTILVTHDGGATWSPRESGVASDLNGVRFILGIYGWAAGDGGVIVRSTDAGETWTRQSTGTTADLRGVFFYNPVVGWAVGDDGTLITTIDGGETWTQRDAGTSEDLLSVRFTGTGGDPVTGWAVGSGAAVVRSVDRGLSWIPVTLDLASPLTTWPGHASSFVGRADISLVATDAGTGVGRTWYRLDGAEAVETTGPVAVTALGTHSIEYWSEDLAGNVEAASARTFSIERLPSRLTIWSNFTTVLAKRTVTLAGSVWPDRADPTLVTVQARKSGSSTWTVIGTRRLYARRYWSLGWRPARRGTYYVRARFAGDGTYLPAYSASRRITVK